MIEYDKTSKNIFILQRIMDSYMCQNSEGTLLQRSFYNAHNSSMRQKQIQRCFIKKEQMLKK